MDWDLFLVIKNPVYQALLFLLLTPVIIFIFRPKSADKAWSIAVVIVALFLIVNAGLMWVADSPWRYFFYSIGCLFVYILLIVVIMPGLLKILQVERSGESAMAFLIGIYQPFALLLVMLIKWIVT